MEPTDPKNMGMFIIHAYILESPVAAVKNSVPMGLSARNLVYVDYDNRLTVG